MRTPHLLLVAVGVLLFASCTSEAEPLPPIDRCGAPPDSALLETSQFVLTLGPNPLQAGAEADLEIPGDDLPGDTLGGAGALWQCWTGTQWESTHQILRPFASQTGDPRYIEPGVEPTIPAVGMPVPNLYRVRIPEVPAGTYRVVDEIHAEGERLTGILIVVVE